MLNKKIYYWPYKGIWFGFYEGEGNWLNDGTSERRISNREKKTIRLKQKALYRHLYPKLCR